MISNPLPQIGFFLFGILVLCTTQIRAQHETKDSLETRIKELRNTPNFSAKDTTHIDLLNDLAYELRYYKADSLLQLSQLALDYSKSTNYRTGESFALIGIGLYYSDKGSHKKSILYFKNALSVGKLSKSSTTVLSAQNYLASEFAYIGNYAKALIYYLEGIDIANEMDNKKMLSILNENVANLYASQKDYVQALEFYKKVKHTIAHIHIKDGTMHSEEGEPEYQFAGEGQAQLVDILTDLKRDNYSGFIAIEPHVGKVFHLAEQEQNSEKEYAIYLKYGQHFEQYLNTI